MIMSCIVTCLLLISVVVGLLTGQAEAVASATLSGGRDAVDLCLSLAGMLCLWSGVMEVMAQCGLAEKLAKFLSPLLGLLYPGVSARAKEGISANFSANLLGLGNAATPLGIQAAKELARESGTPGVASHSLCLLVVCNTASIQLIPTTVATLRAGAGSQNPMEILPCVWLTSLASVTVGVVACQIFAKLWKREGA